MKIRFQEEGIEIASPGQTVLMQLPPPTTEAAEDNDADIQQSKSAQRRVG
jgi:small-conductance mechanosensitive channel